jgi:DNA-binding GntR family transcriptional regulator
MSRPPSPVLGRPQLSDEAASHIRALIMSGQMRPGESVRAETLGAALSISTTPAREALQALRVEGFLELVPRRGFQVAPLTGEDIEDLFQVQGLIAGEMAARAAIRATAAELDELAALHHELLAAAGRKDFMMLEEKNHAFHREINLIAGSRKTLWVLNLMSRYVPRRFYSEIEGWPSATFDDHSKVLEFLKNRDADGAREAMQEHVAHAGRLLARQFTERASA